MEDKVFVIGFPKTGTMSLGRALRALRYDLCPHLKLNGEILRIDGEVTAESLEVPCLQIASNYQAFRNFPWSVIYKSLDRNISGSKFILTRRNPEDWMDSMLRHFGDKPLPVTHTFCGEALAPRGNEEIYYKFYHQHNSEVIEYFRDRPEKLLVLDIEDADWASLCSFLGRRRPMFRAFPHRNRGDFREQKISRLQKVVRYHLGELFGR